MFRSLTSVRTATARTGLTDRRYAHLVVEVSDPRAAVALIERAPTVNRVLRGRRPSTRTPEFPPSTIRRRMTVNSAGFKAG
ncbi:hypothetical protein C2142_34950 [Streptomyces sp. CB01881]|nr:hypothetical protein C2142_34950 [Streptomyces sp. CB01881]